MNNEEAITEFMMNQDAIEVMLKCLLPVVEDHFNLEPEEIDWSHVGTLAKMKNDLENICEIAGIEPEENY